MKGNIFVVYTKENDRVGLYAMAEKIDRCNNLVGYVKNCETFNVCDSWNEAQEIASEWNKGFVSNGEQKPNSEW